MAIDMMGYPKTPADPYANKVAVYLSGGMAFSSNYVTVPNMNAVNLGSNPFTLEAWVYLTGYPANNGGNNNAGIISKDTTISNTRSYFVDITGTASSYTGMQVGLFDTDATDDLLSPSFAFQLNTWYHIAVSRSNGLCKAFINGSLNSSMASTRTLQTGTASVAIGAHNFSATYQYYFPGYLSDVRITNGVDRYLSNFTPPPRTFNSF